EDRGGRPGAAADVDAADVERRVLGEGVAAGRRVAEGVGDAQANARAADAEVDDVAHGHVVERAPGVRLRARSPAPPPVRPPPRAPPPRTPPRVRWRRRPARPPPTS